MSGIIVTRRFAVRFIGVFVLTALLAFGGLSALDYFSSGEVFASPLSPPPPPPPAGNISYDFDGDGKADVGRWDKPHRQFTVRKSTNGTNQNDNIGTTSSKAAPGDFDGDGKTDVGVFDAGTWYIKKSSNGAALNISFGQSGDIPVAGDYDGDGTTDAAIYRSPSLWSIKNSSNGATVNYTFGSAGDIAIPGNFDGDSQTDLAVYRPSDRRWYLQQTTAGNTDFEWGLPHDIPVQGDFDGDGKSDATVYRPSDGTWYVQKSSNGATLHRFGETTATSRFRRIITATDGRIFRSGGQRPACGIRCLAAYKIVVTTGHTNITRSESRAIRRCLLRIQNRSAAR